MGAGIEIQGLGRKYGAVAAVEDVSIKVNAGEFLTILGPSGSGKTTVLSAIAGFVSPTSGRILINDVAIDNLPPERRNVGVVFQHYALFPHMTVAENISFPLEMRSTPRSQVADLVANVARSVRLADLLHRYPKQLSGGQQQRVALARAIVFDPAVLLLDEPLSALDKNLRESMQFELKRLHGETKITMVYVTHDQQEALLLSDRIAVMNHGRIEQIGTPEEVYLSPRNRFVAEFIGESNMMIAKVIAQDGSAIRAETSGGLICTASCVTASNGDSERVSMMIRPERVVVGLDARGLANCFDGKIEERFFIGGALKLKIALTASDSVMTTINNSEECRNRYLPSDQITVGWRSEDAAVFFE